MRGYLLYK